MTISSRWSSVSINTGSYDALPLTNNITVEVKSGTTTVNQPISLLPGTQLKIDDGATVDITEDAAIYVYDSADWKGNKIVSSASGFGDYIPVGYSVANGTTLVRKAADIIDAEVDINGTVEVEGGFYATQNTNIHSSENTGSIEYATTASTSTSVKQAKGTSSPYYNTINYTAAQLKGPDGEYVSPVTEGGEFVTGEFTYPAAEGGTPGELAFTQKYLVYFKDFNGDALGQAAFATGEHPVYSGETPVMATTDRYTYGAFLGWSAAATSQAADYPAGTELPAMGEATVTYYSAHVRTERSYTLVWKDYDGTELANNGETQVLYSQISSVAYPGEAPSRDTVYANNFNYSYVSFAEDVEEIQNVAEEYSYTFTGNWTPSYGDDGVCTLTAVYNDVVKHAFVFLDDQDDYKYLGHVYIGHADAGKSPMEFITPPAKAENAQYTYTASWKNYYSSSKDNAFVDVDNYSVSYWPEYHFYFPKYTPVAKTFTVTWMNGEDVLETDDGVSFDATPAFDSAVPTKDGYVFTGWTYSYVPFGESEPVTGAVKTDKNGTLIEGESYPLVEADITFTADFKEKAASDAIFTQHSLSANADIGVNFYLDIDAYVADGIDIDDMYVQYSWTNDSTSDVHSAVGKVETKNGKFRSSVPVAAKELNDTITAKLYGDGNLMATHTYTASNYLNSVVSADSGTYDDDLVDLCKAMLIYGAKAQLEFGYNTGDLADKNLSDLDKAYNAVTADDLADYSASDSGSPYYEITQASFSGSDEPDFYGLTLGLKSETQFSVVVYNRANKPHGATAMDAADNTAYEVTRTFLDKENAGQIVGTREYIIFNISIPAAKLTRDVSFKLDNVDTVYTINSASYMYAALNFADTYQDTYQDYCDKLRDVVTALYNYSQKAAAYFG